MNTHRIIEVVETAATEPGALDGHEARCSCGFAARTSLSEREAARQGAEHVAYMNRKEGRA